MDCGAEFLLDVANAVLVVSSSQWGGGGGGRTKERDSLVGGMVSSTHSDFKVEGTHGIFEVVPCRVNALII